MHHVEDDDSVLQDLHKDHIREFVHDQFAGARNPVALADPLWVGRKGFDLSDDALFHCGGSSRAGFEIVVGEDFLEVAERLLSPENPHR